MSELVGMKYPTWSAPAREREERAVQWRLRTLKQCSGREAEGNADASIHPYPPGCNDAGINEMSFMTCMG